MGVLVCLFSLSSLYIFLLVAFSPAYESHFHVFLNSRTYLIGCPTLEFYVGCCVLLYFFQWSLTFFRQTVKFLWINWICSGLFLRFGDVHPGSAALEVLFTLLYADIKYSQAIGALEIVYSFMVVLSLASSIFFHWHTPISTQLRSWGMLCRPPGLCHPVTPSCDLAGLSSLTSGLCFSSQWDQQTVSGWHCRLEVVSTINWELLLVWPTRSSSFLWI